MNNNKKLNNKRTSNTRDYNAKEMQKGKFSKNKKDNFKGLKDGEGVDAPTSSCNDPRWYASDEAILRDAASIPFSWAQGTSYHTGYADKGGAQHESRINPGALAIKVSPSYGRATEPINAINIAGQTIYSFVRHANSGSRNYQPADIMIYCMSVSQIYSALNFLVRAYALAASYEQMNRYMPDAMLQAMGFNASSIRSNLSDFRLGINIAINKVSTLAIPNTLTILLRHAFLYKDIYTEGTSVKDQMYFFTPASFLQYGLYIKGTDPTITTSGYDVDDIAPGSALFIKPWPNSGVTYDQALQYVNDLIDAIWRDEDIGVMSGDILKAYGDNGIVKLQSIPESPAVLAPIFDIAVLEQIHNLITPGKLSTIWCKNTFTGNKSSNKGWDTPVIFEVIPTNFESPYIVSPNVVIDPNVPITSDGKIPASVNNLMTYMDGYVKEANALVTTTNDVSPALVMENSRLMTAFHDIGPVPQGVDATMYGEVISGVDFAESFILITNDGSILATDKPGNNVAGNVVFTNGDGTKGIKLGTFMLMPSTTHYTAQSMLAILIEASKFQFFPRLRINYNTTDSSSSTNTKIAGEYLNYDNYAILEYDTLKNLHDVAILNQLNVPKIAKSYNDLGRR